MSLRRDLTRVAEARRELGQSLDDIEARLMPGHVGKVLMWVLKRESKKHPVPFTLGAIGLGGLVVGLISWALVDDSDD